MDRRFQLGTAMLLIIAGGTSVPRMSRARVCLDADGCASAMFAVTFHFTFEATQRLDTLHEVSHISVNSIEAAISTRSVALMHDAGVDFSGLGNATYVCCYRLFMRVS